ncbi:MAG: hypothetical protein NNA21_04785 [Nitrospira sp.]|nr:hypothetical protein [Nitrospira sp.]MCP9463078.1 hypothetical protein [Nitrospira sp.]MCP9475519.1 hypothetical protein [Nitrospira sp.]
MKDSAKTKGQDSARLDETVRMIVRRVLMAGTLLLVTGISACRGVPSLAEQEQLVREGNLALERVTARAVVNVWGEPPHYQTKFTQFFVMPDFTMIPASRVALGESPRGWEAGVHAGEGVFFLYPDRGWLLVFLDDRLVYKETLKAEEMRALVESWAYEDRFKTRLLDGTPMP